MTRAVQLMQLGDYLRRVEIIRERIQSRTRNTPLAVLTFEIAVPLPQSLMRLVEPNEGPVERLAVMRPKHVEAERLAGPGIALPAGQQFMHGDEVACGLRHLLPLDLEEAVMHPHLRHDGRVE